jgi:hypothetical protein
MLSATSEKCNLVCLTSARKLFNPDYPYALNPEPWRCFSSGATAKMLQQMAFRGLLNSHA